jgi:hypothetical protein
MKSDLQLLTIAETFKKKVEPKFKKHDQVIVDSSFFDTVADVCCDERNNIYYTLANHVGLFKESLLSTYTIL